MKKNRVLKYIGITFGVIILLVLVAGLLFPGLLWKKPLGINYTAKDYANANQKIEEIKNGVKTRAGVIYKEFTSEELTAYMNDNEYSFISIKNGEIRVNEDNSIEISAKVNLELLLDEITVGYSKEQLESEIPALGILPDNPNLYIKFNGSLLNNLINLEIVSIQVQGITLPESYYNSNNIKNRVTVELNNLVINYKSDSNVNFNYIKAEDKLIKVEIETID